MNRDETPTANGSPASTTPRQARVHAQHENNNEHQVEHLQGFGLMSPLVGCWPELT